MNPWIRLASGRIDINVDAKRIKTANGTPPKVGDAVTYTDEAGDIFDATIVSGKGEPKYSPGEVVTTKSGHSITIKSNCILY